MLFTVERTRPDHGLPAEMTDILDHMRLTLDDAWEAQRLVLAAMREVEHHGQLALFDQTITMRVQAPASPCWPGLPVRPLKAGTRPLLTLGIDSWEIDPDGWDVGMAWPKDRPPLRAPFAITYTAGFGTRPAELPDDLVLAVLDQAAVYYDARGATDGKVPSLSPHAARITARYRGVRL